MIIDVDSRLYETRDLWASHAPASARDKALAIVDDELGAAAARSPSSRCGRATTSAGRCASRRSRSRSRNG